MTPRRRNRSHTEKEIEKSGSRGRENTFENKKEEKKLPTRQKSVNFEAAVNELELISKEFRCHNMDIMKVIIKKP